MVDFKKLKSERASKCPQCGGKVELSSDTLTGIWGATCLECDRSMYFKHAKSKSECAAAFNAKAKEIEEKSTGVNFELIRSVAALLRTRPESYNPNTRDGPPWGDSRIPNYDLIGHVLEAMLCVRRISCPSTGVLAWYDVEGLKIIIPNKLALRRLRLPDEVTEDWYLDTWKPPPQYGEGAIAVADYLDALADEFEFYEKAGL